MGAVRWVVRTCVTKPMRSEQTASMILIASLLHAVTAPAAYLLWKESESHIPDLVLHVPLRVNVAGTLPGKRRCRCCAPHCM